MESSVNIIDLDNENPNSLQNVSQLSLNNYR